MTAICLEFEDVVGQCKQLFASLRWWDQMEPYHNRAVDILHKCLKFKNQFKFKFN